MTKRSIFKKYFYFCTNIILIAIVSLSSILIMVANQMYKTDVRSRLEADFTALSADIRLRYIQDGEYNGGEIAHLLARYSLTNDEAAAVLDESGSIVTKSDIPNGDIFLRGTVSPASLISANAGNSYFIGNLDGMFRGNRASYLGGFSAGEQKYYLLISTSSQKMLAFSKKVFIVSAVAGTVVLLCTFLIMYIVTKRLFAPIEDITVGSERFGKGDFSQHIPTTGDGEIYCLAVSLNNMADSIAENERVRKSFIANVSHELRTPMTSIGGFVDGILSGTIPPEKQRHYLTIVSDEIKRLSRLVRTMLNISKFEAGEMTINYKKLDIADLLIRTVFLFEKNIDAKHVEIEGLSNDPVIVYADEDLMQQVFFNLIENAIKFVPIWGTITFSIKHIEGKVSIAIKNTGEGLSDDEIPKIFDRFYKTDESRSRDKNGVGLGLSIVRSIIRLHDGRIIVNSTKGEFTEFVIEIPDKMDGEMIRKGDKHE